MKINFKISGIAEKLLCFVLILSLIPTVFPAAGMTALADSEAAASAGSTALADSEAAAAAGSTALADSEVSAAAGSTAPADSETAPVTELDTKALGTQIERSMAANIGCAEGTVLSQTDWFVPGDSISDWMAIALYLAGVPEDYDSYLESLEQMVTDSYEEKGCLDKTKATTYHRIALTALVLGADPTSFGKDEGGNVLNLVAEGTYDYDGDLGAQGINGYTWALTLLDAGHYEIPEDAAWTREKIIEAILSQKQDTGAFGLSQDTPDPDITSMVVQALAPYYDSNEDVKNAIDGALTWLSSQLDDSGAILYSMNSDEPVVNPESTAQAILALTAMSIDPETDTDFVMADGTMLQGLMQFNMGDGIFTHVIGDGTPDYMSTEQALLALISVERLRTDGSRVYDPVEKPAAANTAQTSGDHSQTEDTAAANQLNPVMILIPAAIVVIAALILILILKRRREQK